MLAIRMQRTGRTGHAQFRMVVQDSRFSPTSGRVVTTLGSYNPHSKQLVIDKDKASQYLANGAQPSDTAARLLKKDGVKLPAWVSINDSKKRDIRNPEKLRKNRPEGEALSEAPAEAEAETAAESETTETAAPEVETAAEAETEDDNKAAVEEADTTAETTAEEPPAEETTEVPETPTEESTEAPEPAAEEAEEPKASEAEGKPAETPEA